MSSTVHVAPPMVARHCQVTTAGTPVTVERRAAVYGRAAAGRSALPEVWGLRNRGIAGSNCPTRWWVPTFRRAYT